METRRSTPIANRTARVYDRSESISAASCQGTGPLGYQQHAWTRLVNPIFLFTFNGHGKGHVFLEIGLTNATMAATRKAKSWVEQRPTSSIYFMNAADFHCPAFNIWAYVQPLLRMS